MHVAGGCHCSNIKLSLEWPDECSRISARACGCSFCVKHGGVWTSDPDWRLVVNVDHPALVSAYEFGTRTAAFHVCSRCGIVPLVTCTIDDHLYAVVNVNALDDVKDVQLDRAGASFDDEDTAARLARRKRNWIAEVRFSHG